MELVFKSIKNVTKSQSLLALAHILKNSNNQISLPHGSVLGLQYVTNLYQRCFNKALQEVIVRVLMMVWFEKKKNNTRYYQSVYGELIITSALPHQY